MKSLIAILFCLVFISCATTPPTLTTKPEQLTFKCLPPAKQDEIVTACGGPESPATITMLAYKEFGCSLGRVHEIAKEKHPTNPNPPKFHDEVLKEWDDAIYRCESFIDEGMLRDLDTRIDKSIDMHKWIRSFDKLLKGRATESDYQNIYGTGVLPKIGLQECRMWVRREYNNHGRVWGDWILDEHKSDGDLD